MKEIQGVKRYRFSLESIKLFREKNIYAKLELPVKSIPNKNKIFILQF